MSEHNAPCSSSAAKRCKVSRATGLTPRSSPISRRSSPKCTQRAQFGLVLGGGNIFRGIAGASAGMDRFHADYMGMLATVINALAMQDALGEGGRAGRHDDAINMPEVAEPYIRRRAISHLNKGLAVIFAAGTGNPSLPRTPRCAACDGGGRRRHPQGDQGRRDGEEDPFKMFGSRRFEEISYTEVLRRRLEVMDATAISLCRENGMPIAVFNMNGRGNIQRMIAGDTAIGTVVVPTER